MKKAFKAFAIAGAAVMMLSAAACGEGGFGGLGGGVIGGSESDNKISILTTAVVGTPTTDDDPYKKYILDNYGLDVTLVAATDFKTTAQLNFASFDTMPDIVSFTNIDDFRTIFNQGVLLSDWTPFLAEMPNFASIVNAEDPDRPGQPSVARLMMTESNKLTGLWTLPDPPSWSLKIREDWADEYRATTEGGTITGTNIEYPAGATATNDGPWQPNTPEDLLNFARWIRQNKNANPASPDTYGFVTAGLQTDFGVLGTWIPLMYGAVTQLPYGVYFTEDGNIEYGITDGSHQKMLDFIRTIIDEKLMWENWYYGSTEDRNTVSNSGRVGIEWYPGEISENTQAYFERNKVTNAQYYGAGVKADDGAIVDTTNWWQTYRVPKDPESPNGGYQPSDGFLGQIITVNAATANDTEKMKKICAFLDDLAMTKTTASDGTVTYNRSKAYNALRWGVGIEEGLSFQNIPNSSRVYLYTGDKEGQPRSYRSRYPGAWDWGAFFRSTDDGVVQGTSSETVSPIVMRVIEHDAKTAGYSRRLQYGGILKLDPSTVSSLQRNMQEFEYAYVNRTNTKSYDAFKSGWLDLGGTKLFAEAKKQFASLGFIQGGNQ